MFVANFIFIFVFSILDSPTWVKNFSSARTVIRNFLTRAISFPTSGDFSTILYIVATTEYMLAIMSFIFVFFLILESTRVTNLSSVRTVIENFLTNPIYLPTFGDNNITWLLLNFFACFYFFLLI